MDTVGIFRSGVWHLRDTNSDGISNRPTFAFGNPTDVAVAWG